MVPPNIRIIIDAFNVVNEVYSELSYYHSPSQLTSYLHTNPLRSFTPFSLYQLKFVLLLLCNAFILWNIVYHCLTILANDFPCIYLSYFFKKRRIEKIEPNDPIKIPTPAIAQDRWYKKGFGANKLKVDPAKKSLPPL